LRPFDRLCPRLTDFGWPLGATRDGKPACSTVSAVDRSSGPTGLQGFGCMDAGSHVVCVFKIYMGRRGSKVKAEPNFSTRLLDTPVRPLAWKSSRTWQ
jgi:hypothetical protein